MPDLNSAQLCADNSDASLAQETYGNGIISTRFYDFNTGRLNRMASGPNGSQSSVQNQTYGYDSLGRMTARADTILATSETFGYDNLNRLHTTTLTAAGVPGGSQTSTFNYDAIGNISSKSDVGTYAYTSGKPHAVSGVTGTVNGVTNPSYLYDANGNMQTDGTRSFTWTSFNMPLVISKTATGSSPGSGSATFAYGAEHQRVKQVWTSGSTTSTTYYLGEFDFEKVVDSTGSTYKHYVKVGDRIVTSITRAPSTTTTIYILPDHLDGTSVVTDSTGTATLRTPYDPWGDRRSGFASTVGASDPTNTLRSPDINRGFTGHEMLDQGNLGLVHMNGRVYDPTLARFISADPFVQEPYSTQSLNRFSYVWNNPLGATDPSGYAANPDYLMRAILGAGIGPRIYGVEGPYFNWIGPTASLWYAGYALGQAWTNGASTADVIRAARSVLGRYTVTVGPLMMVGSPSQLTDGNNAHKALQEWAKLQGLSKEIGVYRAGLYIGRLDIGDPATDEVWEIKSGNLRGVREARADIAFYTTGTGLIPGGDMATLKQGSSMELAGLPGDRNSYAYTNLGGGVITYQIIRPPSPWDSIVKQLGQGLLNAAPTWFFPPSSGPRSGPRAD